MEFKTVLMTPSLAEAILKKNERNRKISPNLITAYATDMINGNWNEETASTIAIGSDGILCDGQHRLLAVIKSGKTIRMNVVTGVDPKGIYDQNRARSTSDQLAIAYPDLESVYRNTRHIAVTSSLIRHARGNGTNGSKVTTSEVADYTFAHKEVFDEFYSVIPQNSVSKISLSVVMLAMFMAYTSGISLSSISDFYSVLCSGMASDPKYYPVIAYRNYLKDLVTTPPITFDEIKRAQYSIYKFLTGSCSKQCRVAKDFIYPFPFEAER